VGLQPVTLCWLPLSHLLLRLAHVWVSTSGAAASDTLYLVSHLLLREAHV
jgi:hypothetical protein